VYRAKRILSIAEMNHAPAIAFEVLHCSPVPKDTKVLIGAGIAKISGFAIRKGSLSQSTCAKRRQSGIRIPEPLNRPELDFPDQVFRFVTSTKAADFAPQSNRWPESLATAPAAGAFARSIAVAAIYWPVAPRLKRYGRWLSATRTNHRCSL
jgi:hypothetical protein